MANFDMLLCWPLTDIQMVELPSNYMYCIKLVGKEMQCAQTEWAGEGHFLGLPSVLALANGIFIYFFIHFE